MELTPRIRSLFIVHASVVLFTLGSSISWSGIWPYLNVLDPEVTFTEYGFVVAADALAQVIFSPIFGFIADRLGRIRLVALICACFFMAGNIFYSNIPAIPQDFGGVLDKPRVWYCLAARFIVGIGTSINAAARLYVSKVTTLDERTTHTAILSMGQSIGLIAGPAIQAAVTPLGEKEIDVDSTFSFDMYTVIGYISCTTGLLVFILFLPGIFVEYNDPFLRVGEKKRVERPSANRGVDRSKLAALNNGFDATEDQAKTTTKVDDSSSSSDDEGDGGRPKVKFDAVAEETEERRRDQFKRTASAASLARKRRMQLNKQYSKVSLYSGFNMDLTDPEEEDEIVNQWPDPWATGACIISFFCFFSGLTTVETLMTPIAQNQFGWEDDEALLYVGLFTACSGLLASFCFAWIGPLSKRIDERTLLIVFGCVPLLISRSLMLPMSSDNPPFIGNVTACEEQGYDVSGVTQDTSSHSAAGGGCPYCWCLEQPQLKVSQFMIASAIGSCGFPFCIAIIASILSKILGPIKQGMWMGLMTTAGGCARVLGPIAFSNTYQNEGLYLTLGIIIGILATALIINILTYRRYRVVMDRWVEFENKKAGKKAATPAVAAAATAAAATAAADGDGDASSSSSGE